MCVKVAVMQPYFIPYMGYWQLMNMVDKYVIFDDVNYINRGWITRNRILIDGQSKYFNVSVMGASQNKKINELQIVNDMKLIEKKLRTIEYAYKKAPYYQKIFPLIEKIIRCNRKDFVAYIENSFNIICDYLNIRTEFILSSSLNKNYNLKGQEKILNICELLGATEYYNAIGGYSLYSSDLFEERGMKLKFIKMNNIIYKQFNNEFQPNLSIIDVMMFNSQERIKELLHENNIVLN